MCCSDGSFFARIDRMAWLLYQWGQVGAVCRKDLCLLVIWREKESLVYTSTVRCARDMNAVLTLVYWIAGNPAIGNQLVRAYPLLNPPSYLWTLASCMTLEVCILWSLYRVLSPNRQTNKPLKKQPPSPPKKSFQTYLYLFANVYTPLPSKSSFLLPLLFPHRPTVAELSIPGTVTYKLMPQYCALTSTKVPDFKVT